MHCFLWSQRLVTASMLFLLATLCTLLLFPVELCTELFSCSYQGGWRPGWQWHKPGGKPESSFCSWLCWCELLCAFSESPWWANPERNHAPTQVLSHCFTAAGGNTVRNSGIKVEAERSRSKHFQPAVNQFNPLPIEIRVGWGDTETKIKTSFPNPFTWLLFTPLPLFPRRQCMGMWNWGCTLTEHCSLLTTFPFSSMGSPHWNQSFMNCYSMGSSPHDEECIPALTWDTSSCPFISKLSVHDPSLHIFFFSFFSPSPPSGVFTFS